ncbi:MAG: ABC transporter permease subunit [Anaerolineales bacterium]|nr:ABC transporter permease subunit [Anaerolineales bacterium]
MPENTEKKPQGKTHRIRKYSEAITGYLFIAPATILVLLFGIFPVFFAFYMSLHKWRIKQGRFLGFDNYYNALGSFAYVMFFGIGLLLLFLCYRSIREIIIKSRETEENPWVFALPGFFYAVSLLALARWVVLLLPEFLGIADKLRGKEQSRALFMSLLGDVLFNAKIFQAFLLFLGILGAAIILSVIVQKAMSLKREGFYQTNFGVAFLSLFLAIISIVFTWSEITKIYNQSLDTGEQIGIWPNIITVVSGLVLMGAAFFLWRSASKSSDKKVFWLKIFSTFILLVGGWILVGEIPTIMAQGDKDLWSGLKVTIFFSLGTVPFQLGISLFLSILLFQNLKGSNILRIIFFLPYVTPAIASAAVFKQLFSYRETSPINMLLQGLGIQPQGWLHEPRGIIEILGGHFGQAVPSFLAGPSLALIVIIVHSIWTYVGYDTVIYLAGLGNISKSILDAAEVDGANKWEIFAHVIFPLLSPTTYFLSLIAIIGTFKAFNTIWIFRESLALGTVDTFSVTIFVEFFDKLRYGYATSLAFILFAIILILTFINNQTQGKRVFYG